MQRVVTWFGISIFSHNNTLYKPLLFRSRHMSYQSRSIWFSRIFKTTSVDHLPGSHCICFQMSQVRVEKRVVGRVAHYECRGGSLSITPSGCDIAADADEDV